MLAQRGGRFVEISGYVKGPLIEWNDSLIGVLHRKAGANCVHYTPSYVYHTMINDSLHHYTIVVNGRHMNC